MKRIFRLLLIALVILIAVMTYNTLTFTTKQINVTAINPDPIGDEVLQRLSQAIQIPTISYADAPFDTIKFQSFLSFLDSNFILVDSLCEKRPGMGLSRVYHWPGQNSELAPVLFLAHYDVVPVEEASRHEWTHAPFDGKIADGFVWGRGSMDDKNSVLGLMEAAESLLKSGYEPQRSIYFAFGHDEEIGGPDGAQKIAAIFKNQNLQFEYVLDEGSMIIENALPGIKSPCGLIGLAEKGYVTLEVTAKGKGGHSSMPPKQSTIGMLSEGLAKLEANPMPSEIDGPVREMFNYAGPEMSFPFNALFANLWLTNGIVKGQLSKQPASNALLHTTAAVTIVEGGVKDNVLPAKASATINFRIRPGDTVEDVVTYVEKVMDNDSIIVAVKGQATKNPSKVSDSNGYGFQVIQTTLKQLFPDVIVVPSLVIAGTDSRHYGNVSDNIYRFMPVQVPMEEIQGIHGTNERISIENYKRSIQFFSQLIRNSSE